MRFQTISALQTLLGNLHLLFNIFTSLLYEEWKSQIKEVQALKPKPWVRSIASTHTHIQCTHGCALVLYKGPTILNVASPSQSPPLNSQLASSQTVLGSRRFSTYCCIFSNNIVYRDGKFTRQLCKCTKHICQDLIRLRNFHN